jgi:hypothetical protein
MAMTKLEKIMMDRDTKIKTAETIIFPTLTNKSGSWTVRKKERKKKLMPLSYGRGGELYEFLGQRGEGTFQLKYFVIQQIHKYINCRYN